MEPLTTCDWDCRSVASMQRESLQAGSRNGGKTDAKCGRLQHPSVTVSVPAPCLSGGDGEIKSSGLILVGQFVLGE